MNTAYSDARWQ